MARKLYAIADRAGVIRLTSAVEQGAIPFARDWERRLRTAVEATARHAYDGVTLLVPGVPEAADDDAALDALFAYADWLAPRLAPYRVASR